MKKLLIIILLTSCWAVFPTHYSSSEAVYESIGAYQELPAEPAKKAKKRKAKRKWSKKRRQPKGIKHTQRNRRKTLGVLSLIVGAAIFSLTASFLGLVLINLIVGAGALGVTIAITVALLVATALIVNGVEMAGVAHTEDYKKRRKRRFGIFAIFIGGFSILAAFSILGALLTLAIQAALLAVAITFPPVFFVVAAMLLLFGTMTLIDGVYVVDETYTTYAKDPELNKARKKRSIILSFIMAAGFAILTLFLFLLGGWIIALAGLAVSVAALIHGLTKLSKLKNKE